MDIVSQKRLNLGCEDVGAGRGLVSSPTKTKGFICLEHILQLGSLSPVSSADCSIRRQLFSFISLELAPLRSKRLDDDRGRQY